MIFILFFFIFIGVYSLPGLYLARGHYSEQIKEFRAKPQPKFLIPPKPRRPRITVSESLHDSGNGSRNRCQFLTGTTSSCNCTHREEFVDLKNAWIDYNEWNLNWGRIKDPENYKPRNDDEPTVGKSLAVIPLWPVFLATRFVQGGADNIPDYRLIEQLEQENAIEIARMERELQSK